MSKNMLSYFSKIPKQAELLKNDEVLELKKALETIDLNSKTKLNDKNAIDTELLDKTIELALKYCTLITASTTINNENKYKRDLSIQILEAIVKYHLDKFDQNKLVQILNQDFFDKLLKLFESTSNEYTALSVVQLVINLLGKILHQHISIINPLLQVMEYAFKHNNNDIKAFGYDCWRYLINNFALDKEFFLKPKKLNLLLMPLINKTRSYKNDNVCRSKALAWLCLIENIDFKLPNYLTNVLIPFFNYCFAINTDSTTSTLQAISNENESVGNQNENLKAFLQSRRSTSAVPAASAASPNVNNNLHSENLLRIGLELYISFICNGKKDNVPEDICKNLKHVNLNRNYCIEETLNDTWNWIILLKYFFNVFIPNCHSLDADMVCFAWNRLLDLFEKNQQEKVQLQTNDKKTSLSNKIGSSTFKLNLEDEQELIEYFLLNSIEMIHTNASIITTNQQPTGKKLNKINEIFEMKKNLQKILIDASKGVLKYLYDKNKHSNLLKTDKVFNEIETNFKDICEILLLQSDNYEYLYYLKLILKSIDNSTSLQNENLYQLWSFLQSKLNENFKQLNKILVNSQEIQSKVSGLNFESVYMLLTMPFKYFLKFEQNDLKAILHQLTALCKTFSTLFNTKSQATKTNIWFNNLMEHLHDGFLINQIQNFKQKLNLEEVKTNLVKYFQQYYLFIQLISYLFANLYQFDQQNNENEPPVTNEFKLKLIPSESQKTKQGVSFLIKILNQILDSYINLTQINDTNETENQEQQQQNLQNYTQTILITFMDVVLKLIQNVNQTSHEVDYILCELSDSIFKLFDLNFNLKTLIKNHTNELEIKLILKYFNQTFINSKKFNDHFDHLFNELNNLLQNKHVISNYEFDTSKKLNNYEPIVYSLFKYANLKTQLRHKIVNTWNLTFGKCINEALCYSKRLEKCFYELNNDSSIILLNTTATLSSSTDKDRKLAISLPGFHNCENIIANTHLASPPPVLVEKAKLLHSDNKENSPIISNEISLSASSSSVPIVQLIQNNKIKQKDLELILTDDDTEDAPDVGNDNKVKQINSPTTTKIGTFVFSPANSASRKSYLQYEQKTSPLASANISQALTNSATKRKLDLNSLIDQMPDKDFIRINDNQTVVVGVTSAANITASPLQFKTPLTEHQKEVKKSKSFIPPEIHNVCIELTSSSMDPNQSMTLDFDESNTLPPLNTSTNNNQSAIANILNQKNEQKRVIPDTIEDTITETNTTEMAMDETNKSEDESVSNDWLRKSKRLKIEPTTQLTSSKDASKLQFYSKIKPNKHIDVINLANNEPIEKESEEISPSQLNNQTTKPEVEISKEDKTEYKISEEQKEENVNKMDISAEVIEKDDSQKEADLEDEKGSKMDEEDDLDQNDKSKRRSERIKSKGVKSMQVLVVKLDDTQLSQLATTTTTNPVDPIEQAKPAEETTSVEDTTAPTTTESEPAIQELSKQEEEKMNEKSSTKVSTVTTRRTRAKRPNTITVLPSTVQAAAALISKNEDVLMTSSQESTTVSSETSDDIKINLNTEDGTSTRRTRSVVRRQSMDTIKRNTDELSTSQSQLLKPILDQNSKITKTRSKSIGSTILTNDNSPIAKQKKHLKSKLHTVIEKLQEAKSNTEPAESKEESTTDLYKINTSINEKRRSTRISKRSSLSVVDNDDRYEKDVKIEDPFPNTDESSSTDSESKNQMETDECSLKDEKQKENENSSKKIDDKVPSKESTDKDEVTENVSVSAKKSENELRNETEDKENKNDKTVEKNMENEVEKSKEKEKEKDEGEKMDETENILPSKLKPLETIVETTIENEKNKEQNETESKLEDKKTEESSNSSLNNIQFTKIVAPPPTPTASILKKRRSMNYNLNDLTSLGSQTDNITPSKRRVSFCDSVQIEEIEPNNNAKSIFRTTPKLSMNKAKLVLSPYFNKSPSSSSASNNLSTLTENSQNNTPQQLTPNTQNSAKLTNLTNLNNLQAKFNNLTNAINSSPASTTSTTTSTVPNSTSLQSSPANSLINFISINKQCFLSQRSTIIQQQMQQNHQKTDQVTHSPMNSTSSSSIISTSTTTIQQSSTTSNPTPNAPTVSTTNTNISISQTTESQSTTSTNSQSSVTYENICESQLNDTDPIYPALKDCQLNVDKIVQDLTSSMWANGIIQLLKSKNIITIGDLCQLKTKEINDLPFKTPKIENFMKVIQKFHTNQMKQADEVPSTPVTPNPVLNEVESKKDEIEETKPKQSTSSTPMGSLEEEMAKLEEANSLDISIECESLNPLNDKDKSSDEEMEESKMDSQENETPASSTTTTTVTPLTETENKTNPTTTTTNTETKVTETTTTAASVATIYDQILTEVNHTLINQNVNLNISELDKKCNSLETSDLIKLMNHISTINLKIAQLSNIVIDKLKSK